MHSKYEVFCTEVCDLEYTFNMNVFSAALMQIVGSQKSTLVRIYLQSQLRI